MTTDSATPENEPDDDWDLDDDDLDLDQVSPAPLTPSLRDSEKPASQEPVSPAEPPHPVEPPRDAEPPPQRPASSSPETAPEPETAPAPSEATESSSRSRRSSSSRSRRSSSSGKANPGGATSTSALEKLFLLAVILVFIGLLSWGITTFYAEAPEGELVEFTTEFPVVGEKVTVASVETWWREPVRSGDEVDVGVVIEAQLIPCAEIEISEGTGTTLQVSFRDAEDQLIGDIINLTVAGGRFADSDAPAVTIHATDGFHNASKINPYVNGDSDPWSLVIVESSDSEEPLVKARVSAERKEK